MGGRGDVDVGFNAFHLGKECRRIKTHARWGQNKEMLGVCPADVKLDCLRIT